jgi:hypothetical protein
LSNLIRLVAEWRSRKHGGREVGQMKIDVENECSRLRN